jgi:tetratricopeptide (TPR) repeat protein
MTYAGPANNRLGRWEQAGARCRRAIEANRKYTLPNFELAVALAQLGRLDEARSAVKAGLALNPTFTIARFSEAPVSHFSTYPAVRARIIEALRKAGVPE